MMGEILAGQIRVIAMLELFEWSGMSGTRFSEAVLHEVHACWHSLTFGILLMMIYDLLRLFRLLVKHSVGMTGAEDVIYWLLASLAVFGLFYLENDGALRFYMIGAVILGMILYDRIVSINFFRLLKKAGRCFRIKIRKKTQRQSR